MTNCSENEFVIKQEHEKAKTICQEHKKHCCKTCNFAYYRVRILTHRLNSLFRIKKLNKKGRIIDCLGKTPEEYIDWMENKFVENMTWDNIKPVSKFILEDEKELK